MQVGVRIISSTSRPCSIQPRTKALPSLCRFRTAHTSCIVPRRTFSTLLRPKYSLNPPLPVPRAPPRKMDQVKMFSGQKPIASKMGLDKIVGSEEEEEQPETYLLSGNQHVTERFFDVPLNHDDPSKGTIKVFARIVRKHDVPLKKARKHQDEREDEEDQLSNPGYLLYLQGGPGFECGIPSNSAYTAMFLEKGYRLVLLDQRGTGHSTCISPTSIPGKTDAEKAEYLTYFRADSIVKDCEVIRKSLIGPNGKWTIAGQSFGGFCVATYLSFFPRSLNEAFMFGGIPPMSETHPDEIYRKLFERVKVRNFAYYRKYPRDISRVRRIMSYLLKRPVDLPGGGKLTADRFQQLGLAFGGHGGIDEVHQVVFRACNDLERFGEILAPTLMGIQAASAFDSNIIYALLHEAIYCQGNASNWSADKMRCAADERIRVLTSDYEAYDEKKEYGIHDAVFFTGEMIFSSMFSDFTSLQPLKNLADILSKKSDWPKLYDPEQLKKNTVPVYSATYLDDMYVDYDLTRPFAESTGAFKEYATNVLYHNALRMHAGTVIEALWKLRDGVED